MALSFSKVMSACVPSFLTATSLPQNEKKSCSFSSVVSGARPATWMVYADIVLGINDKWDVRYKGQQKIREWRRLAPSCEKWLN